MNEGGGGMARTAWRSALPLVLVLATAATGMAAQELRWTGTVSYSRGSYIFDATTQTASVSAGLGLSWGRLDFSGTIPVVLQNSELVSQVGGVPLPTGGTEHGVVARRGAGEKIGTGQGSMGNESQTHVTYRDEFSWALGDPFVSASARLHEGSGVVRSVQARLSTKVPVSDLDSGVGTGEWDVGAGASAIASLGSTFLLADLAYWWYGDLPELELTDGLSYSVGLSHPILGSRGSVIASFLGSQSAIASMERPASVALGISYVPRLGRSFSGGVMLGLSESSPDFSVYGGWSVSIG